MPRIKRSFWLGIVLCSFFVYPLEALWYAPITLSGTAADEPQIVSDLDGNAVVVWREFDGVDTSIRAYSVANASLSSPITVSAAKGVYTQANPQVTMDTSSKTSVAVWQELNGSDYTVKAASLPIGGTWTAPVDISTATTESGLFPKVAACPLGYAIAIWQRYDGTKNIIQAASLTIGGSWSAPVDISSSLLDSNFPDVKLDNSGNAVAVWVDITNQTIQSATLPYGGSWSSPVDISAPGDANMPQVAINASRICCCCLGAVQWLLFCH